MTIYGFEYLFIVSILSILCVLIIGVLFVPCGGLDFKNRAKYSTTLYLKTVQRISVFCLKFRFHLNEL
jgi:hypothetical protein